ncbi:MAG: YafY family protein, partial [Sphingopyxis sp.]
MRRTERLFAIIQTLRTRRRPVTGADLARELAVSLRTLYRDMAELTAQRVPVRGEAGVGYVIDSDFDMPPLMLTVDELEAAVLGAAWVAQRGDAALARGARDLVAKLTAAVPDHLRPVLLDAALHPLSFQPRLIDDFDCAEIRAAIRKNRKFTLDYVDAEGRASQRIIWPILMGYMEDKRIIVGWCELRGDFRTFRADRIAAGQMLAEAIPERAATLRRRWRE